MGDVSLLRKLGKGERRTGKSVGTVFAGTYGRCSVLDILTAQLLYQFECLRGGARIVVVSVEACGFGASDSIRRPRMETKCAVFGRVSRCLDATDV